MCNMICLDLKEILPNFFGKDAIFKFFYRLLIYSDYSKVNKLG